MSTGGSSSGGLFWVRLRQARQDQRPQCQQGRDLHSNQPARERGDFFPHFTDGPLNAIQADVGLAGGFAQRIARQCLLTAQFGGHGLVLELAVRSWGFPFGWVLNFISKIIRVKRGGKMPRCSLYLFYSLATVTNIADIKANAPDL